MSTVVAERPKDEIAKKPQTPLQRVKGLLESDSFKDAVSKALPKHLTPDRFCRIAINAAMQTPKLMECTQESLFGCLMKLSQYGLEPDGRRAHLIPYENRRAGTVECQLIIDYKGLAELIYRSGLVSVLHADVVCENDVFDYDMGEIKSHKPNYRQPRGPAYAVYAMCRMKDGSSKAEVMSMDEVEAIRKRSRAGNSGPWQTDYQEMAKKGLALDTEIPTPDGWATMADLSVGDVVFDMHGAETDVIAVSEVKNLPCFRITFSNGEQIVCDDEHRWVATVGRNGCHSRRDGWPVFTVNELFEAKESGEIVSVPVAGPIEGRWVDLPVDPWCLGYWLGNGKSTDGNVTCHSFDTDDVVTMLRDSGASVGAVRKDTRSNACSVGIKGMRVQLREAGLLGNKHIPVEYLRAPVEQRISLLRGLMDSDGHIDKQRGRAYFTSTDMALALQVLELVRSLGEVATIRTATQRGYGKTVECHHVSWQPSFCPCSTSRKSVNYRPRKIGLYRGIKSIEKIPSVPTRCIAVSSETKTYLAGRSMIPTHNTVFRRLSKWLPLSPEIRDAVYGDDDTIDSTAETLSVSPATSKSDAIADILAKRMEASPTDGNGEPPQDEQPEPEPPKATLQELLSRVAEATRKSDLDLIFDQAGHLSADDRGTLVEALNVHGDMLKNQKTDGKLPLK